MTLWELPDGRKLTSQELLNEFEPKLKFWSTPDQNVVWTDCETCYDWEDKTDCHTCGGSGLVRDWTA